MRIGSLVRWLSPFTESLSVEIGVVEKHIATRHGQGYTYEYWVVNFGKYKLQLEQQELKSSAGLKKNTNV